MANRQIRGKALYGTWTIDFQFETREQTSVELESKYDVP